MILFSSRRARKQIGVDPGRTSIKVVLAGRTARGVRVLQSHTIDRGEEGLLTEDEVGRHLAGILQPLGDWPLALTVPQRHAISQVLDLPSSDGPDVKQAIEAETANLGGLDGASIIHDFFRLHPFGQHQNPLWVTIAREESVQEQIGLLAQHEDRLTHVTTTANALVAAHRALEPQLHEVVLVELGSHQTVVAIVHGGQGVLASSYSLGSDTFTEAIGAAQRCSLEEANTLKRSQDLLNGATPLGPLCSAVDGWLRELVKLLKDWSDQNVAHVATPQSVRVRLSGGGALQPGLVEYLRNRSGFAFELWPEAPDGGWGGTLNRYIVAFGAALEAMSESPERISLLPGRLRVVQRKLDRLRAVSVLALVCLTILGALLGYGSWQRVERLRNKQTMIEALHASIEKGRAIQDAIRRRDQAFEQMWPVFESQRRTLNCLRTLKALQEARGQQELWFTLLADLPSYLVGATVAPLTTNGVLETATNRLGAAPMPPSGFVAELCIPQGGDQTLKILSDLVSDLKQQPFYAVVDSLPANLKQNWVEPKLLIPDQTFSLLLELRPSEVGKPAFDASPGTAEAATNGLTRPASPTLSRPERPPVLPAPVQAPSP